MGAGALIGAGISGAASLFGASQQAKASKQAAQAQIYTAQLAADTQNNMFNRTQVNEAPFIQLGQTTANNLMQDLGKYAAPVAPPAPMTQAELEKTPGYAFNLSQGLKATQNGAAARGLGLSGAALKGASTFATGLADSTYQNQFNNAQTIYSDKVQGNQNWINDMMVPTSMGATTATGQGQVGAYTGNSIANSLTGAGSAAAAGINGSAAAWTNGINGVSNALMGGVNGYNQNQLMSTLLGNRQVNGLFGTVGGNGANNGFSGGAAYGYGNGG